MGGLLGFLSQMSATLTYSITFGTVILFGALGEILTEKGGNLNLGVPGIMYVGAIASLAGALKYQTLAVSLGWASALGAVGYPVSCVIVSLLCAFIASGLAGLLYAFLTITLRTNQNVTGLTLTIFGTGIGNYIGGSLGSVGTVSADVTSAAFKAYCSPLVTGLDRLTGNLSIGSLLFRHGFMVYLAVAFSVLLWYFLTKTRTGLSLRSVGENTATADAAGININRYKYLSTCIGAGLSGLGGCFYVMEYIDGLWETGSTIESLGWLAVALVIFATWKPVRCIWGAYLFGLLSWFYFLLPGLFKGSDKIFQMLPYLFTLGVLIMVSLRRRKEDQPPASLGIPYFREER